MRRPEQETRRRIVRGVVAAAVAAGLGGYFGTRNTGAENNVPPGTRTTVTTEPSQSIHAPRPLTLEEKVHNLPLEDAVGQMFVIGLDGALREQGTQHDPVPEVKQLIREKSIGGVILFEQNTSSLEQTHELVRNLQKDAKRSDAKQPLLIGIDQEGGRVERAKWIPHQPAASDIGQRRDLSEAHYAAKTIGSTAKKAGINTIFAPVVDTGHGAAIEDRAYSDNPAVVSSMGAAAVEGFEEAHVISSAKHFYNHGSSTVDSHIGLPTIDHSMNKILNYDLPPFKAAVDAGVPTVMMGHIINPTVDPDKPASQSAKAIRLLRKETGFKGVVITDDLDMEGAGGVVNASLESVKAGADMLIVANAPTMEKQAAIDAVINAVKSGEIPKEEIYDSVKRVFQMKEKYLS